MSKIYVPGLENIPAAESSICTIDVEAGAVWIRGYSLEELAEKASFEEVSYLLFYEKLPSKSELQEYRSVLEKERQIPREVFTLLSTLPKNTHPMDALRTAVSALAGYDPELEDISTEANRRKATRILAKVGVLVPSIDYILSGEKPVEPNPELGHAENILYMIKGEKPEEWEAKAFETSFILYVEHELAASTFTARVISSTLADMYGAVTGAIAALKGPLHGRANEKVMEMLSQIRDEREAEEWVKERLARKERIMGFGHRVYRKGIDPRAAMMKRVLEELSKKIGNDRLYKIAVKIEEVMAREKSLYPNLDFYTAPVYNLLGIPTRLYTPIFVASRTAGWAAHVIEQQARNRLYRPRAVYTGPKNLKYLPVDERS